MNHQIINIQKIFRGYRQRRKFLQYQTKNWRRNQRWYIDGKRNECEKYQIKTIEKIIEKNIEKTYKRINYRTNEIHIQKNKL
jgi:hypothetical protein